jgi:hypothetical protein
MWPEMAGSNRKRKVSAIRASLLAQRALEDGKRTPRAVPPRPAEPDAAASTFDAVLYALQHDGDAALARQSRSLAKLSVRQLESLIASLKRLGADETLLLTLAELLP